MELSSGLAVLLLDLQADDTFLDLCCAPGCKLVLAGLLIGREDCSIDKVISNEIGSSNGKAIQSKENHLDGKVILNKTDHPIDKVISNRKEHPNDKVIAAKKVLVQE